MVSYLYIIHAWYWPIRMTHVILTHGELPRGVWLLPAGRGVRLLPAGLNPREGGPGRAAGALVPSLGVLAGRWPRCKGGHRPGFTANWRDTIYQWGGRVHDASGRQEGGDVGCLKIYIMEGGLQKYLTVSSMFGNWKKIFFWTAGSGWPLAHQLDLQPITLVFMDELIKL